MSTEPAPPETPPAPRVLLNPTVDPEQARPVPSIIPAPGAAAEAVAPAAEPVASPPAPPTFAPPATVAAPREKVEIPSRGAQLDADLEAEIDAALSGAGSLAVGDVETGAAPVAAAASAGDLDLQPGAKVKGKVLSVHGDSVIVDVGARGS